MKADSTNIFVSYSHKKRGPEWKSRLLEHLRPFSHVDLFRAWDDEQIPGGWRWEREIEEAIRNARLAIILLTQETLESEFILERELVPLSRREQDGLIVILILCEQCAWQEHSWLKQVQIRPFEAKPLSSLTAPECERVLRRLATEIAEEFGRTAIESLPKTNAETRIYLEKFPLAQSHGLREEKLIGREQELALLDLAFAHPHTAIVSLVAWGGVGKSMLVQHWLRRLEREQWIGATRVYAWSFYSQGTTEDRQASEDMFLAHALEWFGVSCEPTLSPWDKGRLLADAVARERTLLILDGIEPLQYPPGPMGGQLRAPGVQSLLKQLARKANLGQSEISNFKSEIPAALCLVTTREPLTDLTDFQRRPHAAWGSVLRVDLGNLTDEAGATLLHHAGAKRAGAAEIKPDDTELLAASREVGGHALTLNLLGRFLARAHGGDIRRRDLVKFEEADRKEQGGTTFKMLAAFENWFAKSGEFGARQLAVLRMLALFDRPADAGCIAALRKSPVIAELTAPLFSRRSRDQEDSEPIIEEDWNLTTSLLHDFGLLSYSVSQEETCITGFDSNQASLRLLAVEKGMRELAIGDPSPFMKNVAGSPNPDGYRNLDCHPLLREYFATKLLATHPASGIAAHSRIADYLEESVPYWPEGLAGLMPLYHAIGHRCRAGQAQRAVQGVWWLRIHRGQDAYATRKLGAIGAELQTAFCVLGQIKEAKEQSLAGSLKSWVLNNGGMMLRASGRLSESTELFWESRQLCAKDENWSEVAIRCGNLSEAFRDLGNLQEAMHQSSRCVECGSKVDDYLHQLKGTTQYGYCLFLSGNQEAAMTFFQKAEALRTKRRPDDPLLWGHFHFEICECLMHGVERAAFICIIGDKARIGALRDVIYMKSSAVLQRCQQVIRHRHQSDSLVAASLEYLARSRCLLWLTIIGMEPPSQDIETVRSTSDDLKNNGPLSCWESGLQLRARMPLAFHY